METIIIWTEKVCRLTGTKAVIDGKKYRFDANGICKKKTRAEAARQKAEQVTPETKALSE